MKYFSNKQKIYFIIMLILLISSFILLRLNSFYIKITGIVLFVISIIVGFLMLKEDK